MQRLKNISLTEWLVYIAIVAVFVSIIPKASKIGPQHQISQNGQVYIGTVLTGKYGNVTVFKEDGGIVYLSPMSGPIIYERVERK